MTLLLLSVALALAQTPVNRAPAPGGCVPGASDNSLGQLGLEDLAGPLTQALTSSEQPCPISVTEPPQPTNPNDPNDVMRYKLRRTLSSYVRMRCGPMTGTITGRLMQQFESSGMTPAEMERQLQQMDGLLQMATSAGAAAQSLAPLQQFIQTMPSAVRGLIPGADSGGLANTATLVADLTRASQDMREFRGFLRQIASQPFVQDTAFRCQASCQQSPATANCHMNFPTSREWTPVRL